jgi:hypothetical protein
VPRRFTLVALWAVFAVASVSVGFAAKGMVSDPFTDVGSTADASTLAGPGDTPVTEPDLPAGGATTTAAPSTKPSSTTSSAPRTVRGGIPTQGGYVSGTCQGGLVSVGAAPAVYWKVVSFTSGPVRTARVRLEPAQNAQGERVDVTASCHGGNPVFHADYNPAGGGGDGGDGGDGGSGGSGGDGGDSGSGGSGGSDSGGSDPSDSGSGG